MSVVLYKKTRIKNVIQNADLKQDWELAFENVWADCDDNCASSVFLDREEWQNGTPPVHDIKRIEDFSTSSTGYYYKQLK